MKFRIGAGTIITVILALIIGGYSVYKQRLANQQPPVVERQVQGTTHGVAPVPEFALRQKKALHLTTAQEKQIQRLAKAYRADIAPVQEQLNAASADYQQYMERAKATSRPEARQVTAQSRDIQRLSGVLSMTRHAYWEQVVSVLSAIQRQTMTELVAKATLVDLQ